MTGLWGLEEHLVMIAADSRSGALVGRRLQAGEWLRTKGFQCLRPAVLFHLRILSTSQSCLANSVGPPGSVLNVTSSRKPSLTTDHQSGLAALCFVLHGILWFLHPLSCNCLSRSEWPISSMRARLGFVFVPTVSPEPGTVFDKCAWKD